MIKIILRLYLILLYLLGLLITLGCLILGIFEWILLGTDKLVNIGIYLEDTKYGDHMSNILSKTE